MVIAKSALQEFVQKDVQSYSYLKSDLDTSKGSSFRLKLKKRKYFPETKPMRCQVVGTYVALVKKKQDFLFFYDPGLGKSKMILDILSALIAQGNVKRALIVVDNDANMSNFAEEVKIHARKLKACVLTGSSAQRWETLDALQDEDIQIVIIHYLGLVHLLSQKVEVKRKSRKKRKLKIDKKAAKRLGKLFEFVCFDEVHNCKNSRSLTYKACYALSSASTICYRYGLTGTPTGKNPIDFWAQFKLIDRGETLGTTIGLYRSAFFTKEVHPFFGWVKWKFNKRQFKEWRRLLDNRSLTYEDAEVHDLPKLFKIKVAITPSSVVKEYYDSVISALRATASSSQNNKAMLKNSLITLRQLASGFVKDEDGTYVDFQNPTIEWIVDKVNSFPVDDKVVVFHDFIHSGERISKALQAAKIKHVRIWGGTKDKSKELHKFKTDKDCKVLVANIKSGAVGLNLQMANRVILFELPTAVILFRQLLKRCHRKGQKKRTYVYFPMPKGTILEKQREHLESGSDILQAVMQGKTKL